MSATTERPILPGATVGILGGGQLGRMLALAARRMGYRSSVFTDNLDSPGGQAADTQTVGSYDDANAVLTWARHLDVVTFEFENVAQDATEAAAVFAPVRPAGSVLYVTQNRLREKSFLWMNGFPVAPFAPVLSASDLTEAAQSVGLPAVLKTAGFGYDGKGQRMVDSLQTLNDAYAEVSGHASVLEGLVVFERELSIVAARGTDGSFAAFSVCENRHVHHILDVTVSRANIPEAVEKRANEMARGILEALDVVGVLCIELFLLPDGSLVVNELAPRPHNSGHHTIESCVTDQYEQQLRAICGLPLGDTTQKQPAAMANLLGDLWADGEPNWAYALQVPGVALHLYGKSEARPGRKMGHLTACAPTIEEAERLVTDARANLLIRR